jgi:sphingomyelin phosphodiesterase acid-like 3
MRWLALAACALLATMLPDAAARAEDIPTISRVLLFSDPHFNPMDDPKLVDALAHADPEQWPTILERTTDRMTGHYGKDPGWALLRSALDAMRRAEPHPTLLMVLGDFLAHRFRPQFNASATDHSDAAFRDFVRKTMAFMAREISRRFPTTPIVAAIGNDDDVCGDYQLEPGGPFLKDTLPIVRRMLDGEIPDGFDAGWTATGNYGVRHPTVPDLRIVFVNSIYFSRNYRDTCGHGASADPADATMRFLTAQLEAAQAAGDKIWLIQHIPPGADAYATLHNGSCPGSPVMMWRPEYQAAFDALMHRYGTTVLAGFAGHTHMDEFRLIGPADAYDAFTLITPAISPIFEQNPGFQIIEHNAAGRLLDRDTYYLANLATAGDKEPPDWKLEYSFDARWQLRGIDLLTLTDLNHRLATDPADRVLWTSIFPVANPALWHLKPGERSPPEPVFRDYFCTESAAGTEAFRQCYCGEAAK